VVFVEKNKLKKIVEKPKEETGKFISTGIYKLSNTVFNDVEKLASEGVYALSSVVQSIVDRGEEIRTITAESWMDIVYPWDLIRVNEAMIHQSSASIAGTIEKGVVMKGAVSIGKDTTIYSGCYIVGPVVIGEGCEIGPNACIFPSTTIGDNAVVNPFNEIRNSVIMDDVHIASHSTISHSVIGMGTRIGNNFSAIPGEAIAEIEQEFKKLKDIGVMIGEDSIVGDSVATEPGIIIGRRCKVSSLNRITKNIPSKTNVM